MVKILSPGFTILYVKYEFWRLFRSAVSVEADPLGLPTITTEERANTLQNRPLGPNTAKSSGLTF